MENITPASELQQRLERLRRRLDQAAPNWEIALVTRRMSLFYLCGTMVSGSLWIPRDGEAVLFVQRGYGRAQQESAFPAIERISGFREMTSRVGCPTCSVHLERDGFTLSAFERLERRFSFTGYEGLDAHLLAVRAVKSPFEIAHVERSGRINAELLEQLVPTLLQEGMSEAELAATLMQAALDRGHQGVTRYNLFEEDLPLGYINFGDSALVPTNFPGPDGCLGLGPAAPFLGSREKRLKRGDLVFIDIGCAHAGYHTDKTAVYCFGASPPEAVQSLHQRCIDIQDSAAALLTPGRPASEVYEAIMAQLDPEFQENFMGLGEQQVKFLGHGVGLHMNELPLIAQASSERLERNMVIALEPKKAIPGLGMVGVENSFVVTGQGGRSVTGSRFELIEC
jgi:Xaa-Pro dipeptidase